MNGSQYGIECVATASVIDLHCFVIFSMRVYKQNTSCSTLLFVPSRGHESPFCYGSQIVAIIILCQSAKSLYALHTSESSCDVVTIGLTIFGNAREVMCSE